MPLGPSHGARGGGGGFSSSRGGSHHRHSGGGSNLFGAIIGGMIGGAISSRRRERHHHHYNDSNNYNDYSEPATPSRRKPTAFLILTIITLVFTFFTVAVRNGFVRNMDKQNDYIASMTTDYNEYKDIIDKAKEQESWSDSNPSKTHFIATAKFNKYIRDSYSNTDLAYAYKSFNLNSYEYFFVVAQFKAYGDTQTTPYRTVETYAQFTRSQINSLNGEIEVAYTFDGETCIAINTSYIFTNGVTDSPEYQYTLALAKMNELSAQNTIWVIVGECVFAALFIFLYIVKLKKYYKLVKEDEIAYSQKQQAEVHEARAKAESAQKEASQKNRVCAFCGSTVPDGEDSCPACGSRVFQ